MSHTDHADPLGNPSTRTVYTYGRRVSPRQMSGKGWGLPLVKRQDRCDDGSISTTYYLELSAAQYAALGGE